MSWWHCYKFAAYTLNGAAVKHLLTVIFAHVLICVIFATSGYVVSVLVFYILCISCQVYGMLCAIWYHLYKLKNVKNTHRGVLLLGKLQVLAYNFTKSNTALWVFFTFFKLYELYQIAQSITYELKWNNT